SEEHTSELQSLTNLVCRLLLEKKYTSVRVIWIARAVARATSSWTGSRSLISRSYLSTHTPQPPSPPPPFPPPPTTPPPPPPPPDPRLHHHRAPRPPPGPLRRGLDGQLPRAGGHHLACALAVHGPRAWDDAPVLDAGEALYFFLNEAAPPVLPPLPPRDVLQT